MKRVLSLFSGCGGLDIGFEGDFWCLKKSINATMHASWIAQEQGAWVKVAPTCFETIFANDILPEAKAAWVSYFAAKKPQAAAIYHLESVVDLVKRAQAGEAVFPSAVDIVTGGFPCQDFSVAGKRLGFKSHKSHLGKLLDADCPSAENRGQLYMWMREVITLTAPKLFIAENVKGLTNLADVQQIIEHDFAEAGGGYVVVPAQVLYAPDYGVPQSRERVIFFGFKKDALTDHALKALQSELVPEQFNPYPPVTHGSGLHQALHNLLPTVTCADAFVDLLEPDQASDPAQQKYSKAKFMGAHCQGQIEVNLQGVGPTIRSQHHGNIEYRRLSAEHGGKNSQELSLGLMERRLTIRECARLQTFPDDYQFILPKTADCTNVTTTKAYQIIGNAVPCVLAYNIAKNLERKWDLYFR